MRIVLHIGPYKTGTTSIQSYLLAAIGSKKPHGSNAWYPSPDAGGPGHSAMAYDAIKGRTDELRAVVATARDRGVSQLVVSSEAFTQAYPRKIAGIAEVLGDDVHLVVTLNSPIRRAAATWQEQVKHGHQADMQSSMRKIFEFPEYRPDFLRRFVEGFRPVITSVIFSSRDDPASQLIENFCKAIGLSKTGVDPNIRINTRLSFVELEILRALNIQLARSASFPREKYMVLRNQLLRTFQSPQWRETCPQIPIATPDNFLPRLERLAQVTLEEVRSLSSTWPVTVYGDPNSMLEAPIGEGRPGRHEE